jgi:membrane-associated phospholipid phosphatase
MFSLLHRADMVPFISLAFFIAGSLGFARLYLKKHSEKQVYVGYLLGLFIAVLFIPVSELIIIHLLYK